MIPGAAPLVVAARKRHGLSALEVAEMTRRQAGLCLICVGPLPEPAIIDHDHAMAVEDGHDPDSGCKRCVRGLLCGRCNTLLGMARDDEEVLSRAAAYLAMARDVRRRIRT